MKHAKMISICFVLFPLLCSKALSQDVPQCKPPSQCVSHVCGRIEYNCPKLHAPSSYECEVDGSGKETGYVGGDQAHLCQRVSFQRCTGSYQIDSFLYGRNSDFVVLKDSEGTTFWESGALERGAKGGLANNQFSSIRCRDDLNVHQNYVTVRHGKNLDLFWFVGLNASNEASALHARLQDGSHHGVILTSRGPLVKMGVHKDVYIQYCFDGNRWTSSDVMRSGERHDYDCNKDAITFFNVASVEYHPPRPVPVCSGYPKTQKHPTADVYCEYACDPLERKHKL